MGCEGTSVISSLSRGIASVRDGIGEILEVLGKAGHEHYRVRWDDDHESVFYPSNDATIQHVEHRGTKP